VVGGGVGPQEGDPPPEGGLRPVVAGEGAGALDEETVGDLDVVAAEDDVEEGVALHHDVAVDLTESRKIEGLILCVRENKKE